MSCRRYMGGPDEALQSRFAAPLEDGKKCGNRSGTMKYSATGLLCGADTRIGYRSSGGFAAAKRSAGRGIVCAPVPRSSFRPA